MRIAVTADVHLSPGEDHPERLNALADILGQLSGLDVDHLIIAGDLFDRDKEGYAEFDGLCNGFPGITIEVIPGNHDLNLAPGHLLGENVTVHDQPSLVEHDGRQMLFVPFVKGTTMGETIAEFSSGLVPGEWVLVGHGNYGGGLSTPHPYEPGVYMPLARRDIDHSQPASVLLGHIHVPTDTPPVHYPGSPCGLNITESGPRRFLVLDTDTLTLTPHTVNSDIVFMRERFVVLPEEGEDARLQQEITARLAAWDLNDTMRSRVQVRIEASGFCEDREAIRDVLVEGFSEYTLEGGQPRLTGLEVNPDLQLMSLASRVRACTEQFEWPWGDDEPEQQDVILEALAIVYRTEPPR